MKTELNNLIKEAMLSGNRVDLSVYRFIKNEFMKFETAENAQELTEEAEQKVLIGMVKQREDSVNQYRAAGRNNLADTELAEIEVIKRFLPKEATENEINEYLDAIYSTENRNMGEYIKQIKQKFPTANGKTIADLVKAKLTI